MKRFRNFIVFIIMMIFTSCVGMMMYMAGYDRGTKHMECGAEVVDSIYIDTLNTH